MNGMRPKFMENQVSAQSYFEQLNPYVNAPFCNVNLLELSRYAKNVERSWSSLHKKK